MVEFDNESDFSELFIFRNDVSIRMFINYLEMVTIEYYFTNGVYDRYPVNKEDVYMCPLIRESFGDLEGDCVIHTSRSDINKTISNIVGIRAA